MIKYLSILTITLAAAFPALAHDGDDRHDAMHERVESRVEDMHEQMDERRADLQEQLGEVRDARKRAAIERIQNNLTALNERMVRHFTNVLDRLEEILERIGTRAERAEDRGLDISMVDEAIEEAEEAIAEARAAVEDQADETYEVEITDEDTLRADVRKARQALHADLRAVFAAVKEARDAVHDAATTLAKIPRGNDNATSTPTSTISE